MNNISSYAADGCRKPSALRQSDSLFDQSGQILVGDPDGGQLTGMSD